MRLLAAQTGLCRSLSKAAITNMKNRFALITLLIVLAVAAAGVYRVGRAQLAAEVYRDRLNGLGRAYDKLLDAHNQIIQKTAVTELLVQDGTLCLAVRNANGIVRQINTPFDPSREIYVDYVVLDGRLWIRRLYDAHTPPSEGLIIDPQHEQIDWSDARYAIGKAVYRSLSEGRWIVTVTGNGALGLVKTDAEEALAPPPPVKDFDQIKAKLNSDLDRIGPSDVLHRFLSPDS